MMRAMTITLSLTVRVDLPRDVHPADTTTKAFRLVRRALETNGTLRLMGYDVVKEETREEN